MATLSKWGDRIDVGGGEKYNLQVAALANGTFVAVWSEFNDGEFDVYAQLYNADGSGRGPSFKINDVDETPSNQMFPAVTALKNGGFAVAWLDFENGGNSDIRVRTLDADGNPTSAERIAIHDVSRPPEGGYIAAHIESFGDSFVVMAKHGGAGEGVGAQFFDGQGEPRNFNLPGTNFQSYGGATIVGAPAGSTLEGKFITAALDTALDQILVQIHSAGGGVTYRSIDIAPLTDSVSVAALPGGRFMVAWKEIQENSIHKVRAIVYGSNGNSQAAYDLVAANSEIRDPVIAALPNGGFALAYRQNNDIWARTYKSDGVPDGQPLLVHNDVEDKQTEPTITVLIDGRFIVGWNNEGAGASTSLRAQILDSRDGMNWTGSGLEEHYIGSSENDIINGAGGSDTLLGGGGDDILIGGLGADTLIGGDEVNDGLDWASYIHAASGVVADLSDRNNNVGDNNEARGDIYIEISNLQGSNHGDSLTGNGQANSLSGLGGNDVLHGGGGNDHIHGGAGDDILRGGSGADTLIGGEEVDDGLDWASYMDATSGVTANLSNSALNRGEAAAGDVYIEISGLQGSNYGDSLTGNGQGNALSGLEGMDLLNGAGGNDDLHGGDGNDTLIGGAGNDTLDGGGGSDTAVFSGNRSQYQINRKTDGSLDVTVTGADGIDVLKNVRVLQFQDSVEAFKNAAPTSLSLSQASIVENAPRNVEVGTLAASDADGDRLTYSLVPGSSGSFAINGNKLVVNGPLDFETKPVHQVTIQASDGFGGVTSLNMNITVTNDTGETTPFTIRGTARADVLSGENGHDTIYGSGGNDQLTGNRGKDVFVFDSRLNKSSNVDKVMDFRYQDDSIYLDNKVFTKLGSGTFSKPKKFKSDMFTESKKAQDAEDRIVYDKKTGALYYDQDGTGAKAQIKIATITNKTKLYYHDFFVV
ncbi:cadherin domain-containing protein [Microvirga terrestris]|uniref:Cadherin domain-containing protein n=1 Tax=Microvirga terrestris TaxID=2791024 RepID=A0ABS0HT07_9HYPH|nr:cadherin domain-containing protein [Microvirga terrestris]MBF9196618.1 cadherin domain-containing protein [Microvirga terrestris]